jgi:hypothetical protein
VTWTQGGWPRNRSVSGRERDFFVLQSAQTSSGAHLASYSVGNETPYPLGLKQQGREVDHSPPYSAEVKNEWG